MVKKLTLFYGIFFGLFLSLLGIFWQCSSLLMPFFLGAMGAYIGVPLVNFLEKKGLSRGLGSFFLGIFYYILLFIVGFFVIFSLRALYDFFVLQWTDHGPKIQGKSLYTTLEAFCKNLDPIFQESLHQTINDAVGIIKKFLMYMMMNGLTAFQLTFFFLLSPVIAFYLMKDWPFIFHRLLLLVPPLKREKALSSVREIHRSLGYYLHGQFSVCLFLGIYYALTLKALSLPWSITLGLLTGIFSFVPYIGFFLSFTTSVFLTWILWGNIFGIMMVLLVYALGYALEALILVPFLIGKRTGLHPVWVLFAVLVGGTIKGFLGVFLALPFATFLGACWRLLRQEYLEALQEKTLEHIDSQKNN